MRCDSDFNHADRHRAIVAAWRLDAVAVIRRKGPRRTANRRGWSLVSLAMLCLALTGCWAPDLPPTPIAATLIPAPTANTTIPPLPTSPAAPTTVPPAATVAPPASNDPSGPMPPAASPPAPASPVAPQSPSPSAGRLVVQMVDDQGQPVAGGCLRVAGQDPALPVDISACDDEGTGIIEFLDVPAGLYSLVEETAPPGYETAASQSVEVQSGQPTESLVTHQSQQGSLDITTIGAAGEPLPDACYMLEGRTARPETCDNTPDDANPEPGIIAFAALPVGEYQVIQTRPPVNTSPAPLAAEALIIGSPTASPPGGGQPDRRTVTVAAGQPNAVTFTNVAATGALDITRTGPDGQLLSGSCFSIAGAAANQEVCDNESGDANPEAGRIRIEQLAPGAYTARESRPPDGYEAAAEQMVDVLPGASGALTFAQGAATGVMQISVLDQEQFPIADVCFTVIDSAGGQIASACDNDPSDGDSNVGIIRLSNISPGEYILRAQSVPANFGTPADLPITVEPGTPRPLSITLQHLETTGQVALQVPVAFAAPNSPRLWLLPIGGATSPVAVGDADFQIAPAFNPGSTWLAYIATGPGEDDRSFTFYDPLSQTPLPPVSLSESNLTAQALAWRRPQGDRVALAVGMENSTANVLLLSPYEEPKWSIPGQAPFRAVSKLMWSPDGLRLAIEGTPADGSAPIGVWVIDPLADETASVEAPADGAMYDALYEWSALHNRVLVGAGESLMLANGQGESIEIAPSYQTRFFTPRASSSGRYVAYDDPNRQEGVTIVDTIDTNALDVCYGPAKINAIAWRPGTAHLAVSIDESRSGDGPFRIELLDAENSCNAIASQPLEQPLAALRWAPDGGVIALIGGADDAMSRPVWLASWNDLVPHAVDTAERPISEVLGWSPDGSVLAVAPAEDAAEPPANLLVLPRDAMNIRPVSGSEVADAPAISQIWWPPEILEVAPEPGFQPTQPADAQPTQQSDAQPTQPADAQPTQQAEAQPTQQADAQPTQPADAQPTQQPDFQPTHQVGTSASVNVRAGPSSSDQVIIVLPPATPLQYLNEESPTSNPEDGSRWMRFHMPDGQEGWLREIDVVPFGPAGGDAPTPTPAQPAQPADAQPTQNQSLLALLPTQEQVPAGLVLADEAERSKADVVASLGGSDEASQLLDDWGWSGNAFREYIAAEDAVTSGGTTYLNASVHRFADAESAANALIYMSDQVLLQQGLQEVAAPAIGESARLLFGAPDGVPLAVLYAQEGPIMYRIGGSTNVVESDPTAEVLAVASAIIKMPDGQEGGDAPTPTLAPPAAPPQAPADDNTSCANLPVYEVGALVATTADVNLHEAPSSDSAPIRDLPTGTQLQVSGEFSEAGQCDWWPVTVTDTGQGGFVLEAFLGPDSR